MAPPGELEDVATRERQLEAHLLHSPDYLQRCSRAIQRQVVALYLEIALLILLQAMFAWRAPHLRPVAVLALAIVTSLLGIANCVLLIRTKACRQRLNDAWLRPNERQAVHELRHERQELMLGHMQAGAAHAG